MRFAAIFPLVVVASAVVAQEPAAKAPSAPPARASAARPPNLVYVLADDLGYGELGCYGQRHIRTPNLDRLAAEGMRFTQHYAGSPVCAPSRCVLLTGRASGHAAIRDNLERQPEGQLPLPAAEITVAEVLRAAGYATGGFGKWGLGSADSEGAPQRQGFDHFFGYLCQRHAHDHFPRFLWRDGVQVELAGNDGSGTGAQYAPDAIVDAACAFVHEHAARPFFLYLPLTLPHLALQVPDAALAGYRGAFAETPYSGTSYRPHATPRACYAAMVTHLDALVGRLLAAIAAEQLDGDTLVVFSSDNGPTHLSAQVDTEFFASAGPLRGHKGSVFEGGLRVPMLARWPGQVAAGAVSEHVSAFQDVLPTLAALAGANTPPECLGISFAPTLLGRGEQRQHAALVWDFPGYGGQIAVRAGAWKLVWRDVRTHPDAAPQLFDLDQDPGEQHDQAATQPQQVARLLALARTGRSQPAEPAFCFGVYEGAANGGTGR